LRANYLRGASRTTLPPYGLKRGTRDEAGRAASSRVVEHATGSAISVVRPDTLATAEDPDAPIRREELEGWDQILESRECERRR
jgi:hypothetical protein